MLGFLSVSTMMAWRINLKLDALLLSSGRDNLPITGHQPIYLRQSSPLLIGWHWIHLVLRPLLCLLYQPQMIDDGDCGAIGGIRNGRGNRSTRRKPDPMLLCSPQIPRDLSRARTRSAAVESWRVTAKMQCYWRSSSQTEGCDRVVSSVTLFYGRLGFYFRPREKLFCHLWFAELFQTSSKQ
jgi:hypothetical protein